MRFRRPSGTWNLSLSTIPALGVVEAKPYFQHGFKPSIIQRGHLSRLPRNAVYPSVTATVSAYVHHTRSLARL
ncbi:hypothetical protein C8Q70DRAFT_379511 [Cubamyces menziesii]|nr:hypothetical protein C8Q70DRAFT_379511 [Cubamyces menziesii]